MKNKDRSDGLHSATSATTRASGFEPKNLKILLKSREIFAELLIFSK
jgi:hypothetical protein